MTIPTRNHLDASLEAIIWRIGTLPHHLFAGDQGEHPPLLCANGHQWRDKREWTQTTVRTRSCTYP